ncbi:MAG: energy-coupling factor transporter transmembrane protein EcfT [Anaerolineales bacterium]|nr:energy-coupling factor transporter transmembrane protein EcfT [Anaerolineales bacterium]
MTGTDEVATEVRASPTTVRQALHPGTWVIWLVGVAIALTTTRNPWYLALVLLLVALVLKVCSPPAGEASRDPVISPWRFGLIVVATSTLFNVLMVHVGDTVLFNLPAWLPLIGGPLTLEAAVYGALNGLVLAGIFAAFAVFNRTVPVRAALRLAPRAYYPVAVVMSIAVTFVPATQQQFQQIREAQAVRGLRMNTMRSWLPLVVPLLEGSLERSFQLAEAMMARGFASAEENVNRRPQVLLLAGLGSWLAGWLLRLVWRQPLLGDLLLIAGTGALGLGLWLAGRQHPHTVYRPTPWHWQDGVVIAGAALVGAIYLFPLPGIDRSSLFYYPYPALTWPAASALIVAGTLGLGAPAVVR